MAENNEKSNYRQRTKSQYNPEKQVRSSPITRLFAKIAIIIRNFARAVISRLDRITGFKYGDISPYEAVRTDEDNKGKTKEDVEKEAKETGKKDQNLSKEAKDFESFLNSTVKLSLNCDNITVTPKQYRDDLNVLDVHVFKGGKETIYSISKEGNGLMCRSRYAENVFKKPDEGSFSDVINGAYVEFNLKNEKPEETQEKIVNYIEDRISLTANRGNIHSFMVNGILLDFKKTDEELICQPRYVKGVSGIIDKPFGKEGPITLKVSEINKEQIRKSFGKIISRSARDAREYFDTAKDQNKGAIFAAHLNKVFRNSDYSFEYAEIEGENPDKDFAIKVKGSGEPVLVTFNNYGNVKDGATDELRPLLEGAYVEYAKEYGDLYQMASPNSVKYALSYLLSQIDTEKGVLEASVAQIGRKLTVKCEKADDKDVISIAISDLAKGRELYSKKFDSPNKICEAANDMSIIFKDNIQGLSNNFKDYINEPSHEETPKEAKPVLENEVVVNFPTEREESVKAEKNNEEIDI